MEGGIDGDFLSSPVPQTVQRLDLVIFHRGERYLDTPEVKLDRRSLFGIFLWSYRVGTGGQQQSGRIGGNPLGGVNPERDRLRS